MRRRIFSSLAVPVVGLVALFPCFANDVLRDPVKKRGAGPLFQVRYGNRWGYMNRKGRTVILPQFDDEGDFFDGLARVRRHGKWGYLNKAGRLVVAYRFDDAGDFREGLAPVRVGRKWGFIDDTGRFVIKRRFQAAAEFHDGLAQFEVWDTIRCSPLRVGGSEEVYSKEDAPAYAFTLHSVRPAATGGCFPPGARFGFIDRNGQIVIAPSFHFASDFSEGLAIVKTQDPPAKFGYIDKAGRLAIEPQFDQAEPFSEGLALVEVGARVQDGKVRAKWGFINREGKFEIPARFRGGHSFSEGLAAVELSDGLWGYIDRRGAFAIPPNYYEASPFSDGLALVWPDDGTEGYYIDRTGRRAVVIPLGPYWPFSDGLTVAGQQGRRKYVNKKGKIVAPYEVNPGF
jgi:hypothetical protein